MAARLSTYATAVVFATAVLLSAPLRAEPHILNIPSLDRLLVAGNGAPVLLRQDGGQQQVTLSASGIALAPITGVSEAKAPAGALPDGLVATRADGVAAWLDQPTERYRHAVLGDGIEAGALTVAHPDGTLQTLTLGFHAVFEDRYPRFVDMNGDGKDELLVVKAYHSAGGALVLIEPGMPDVPPRIVAEGPAIGTPNRWLNPVGVGDVDGDGRNEALVVITPHIGGTLTAYEWQGDRLVVDHQVFGFSNHAIGDRELALAAVKDIDGDGIAEVVVPNRARTEMTVVSFKDQTPRILDQISVRGGVRTRVVVYDLDGDDRPEITFGSGNDDLIVWRPRL